MAGKISELTPATALAGQLELLQGGANLRAAMSLFAPERLPVLSNNGTDATNDVDFTAGSAWDSTDAVKIPCSAMTKRLDAGWAAGSGNGGRNSGAAIADTTYHWYAVSKADGADPDYYAHTSLTVATVITALQAETGGGSYIYARRIGSILRESAAIVAFSQNGDEFLRLASSLDYNTANPGTSAVSVTCKIPTGLKLGVLANYTVHNSGAGVAAGFIASSPDVTDVAPSLTAAPLFQSMDIFNAGGGQARDAAHPIIRSNTSAQVRIRLIASDASVTMRVATLGWIDTRGRDR